MNGRKNRFDDMEDDIPDGRINDAGPADSPYLSELKRMAENRRKNSNRKYKPQKGRLLLAACLYCDWKCRASRAVFDIGVPDCPNKECAHFGKPLLVQWK